MRGIIAICVIGMFGCGKGGAEEGAAAAIEEQQADQREREARGGVAKKISPPVPGMKRLPCEKVIDAEAFTAALSEAEPITVKDVTQGDAEAAASCSLIRGGKRPTEAEQAATLKKVGRLGVMPGDEICNVTAYCWTIEDAERFRKKCAQRKDRDDETMGTYACVQIVAQGADDVQVFRFFDDDTKCILQVRGGPSNVNNDLIRMCARTARDSIGPEQIKVN